MSSKRYCVASDDVKDRITKMVMAHHSHLADLRIDSLFVFSDDDEAVLTHQGYPAMAVVKIVSTKERAAGLGDALIVFDRHSYDLLTMKQRDALIDHELTHLLLVFDKDGHKKKDCLGRPKLEMRQHDRQFGWFDDVAQRHGENSQEVIQAKALIEEARQLYFDFSEAAA